MFDGLKHLAARFIYKSISYSTRNAYESGATGRRLARWMPPAHGPNSAVINDLERIRNRARDQVRNNPWISRGIKSWEANEIGCGITLKSAAPDEDFRKRADDLWNRQVKVMDADGVYDFNGMLRLIVRTRREAGEIFIRRRPRLLSHGLPVPIQYQLLEPEFCPVTYNQSFNGDRVYAGIGFNAIGKRTVYYMYRSHPGDAIFYSGAGLMELSPIPAESIIHHYDPLRAGQIRGVPAVVQAMIKAKDFDEYDDAELVRKKNRAAYTGAITRPKYEGDTDISPLTGLPVELDDQNVPVEEIQAGSFFTLQPGEDLKMFEGDNTGGGYADFVHQQLLGIGAGQDVPYEFISWDFSKLNDRTLRVVLAEYQRIIEQDRWLLTIPQVCVPIWQDFIDYAVISGALKAPADFAVNRETYSAVSCHPEGWPYLHELQDANAAVVRLKAGLTSRKRELADQGIDVRDVDQERQEDAARSKQMGLAEDYGSGPAPGGAADPSGADPNQNGSDNNYANVA